MRKEYKNRQINLRLTEKEFHDLKDKSINYPTLSSFILDACMKFDDALGIKRLDAIREWCDSYKKCDAELNKIGSNINQIAHYINKLSSTGIVATDFIPELKKQYDDLINLLTQLSSINKNSREVAHKFLIS